MWLTPSRGMPQAALFIFIICLSIHPIWSSERWSRQLTGEGNGEWVPLQSASPSKRQANARVLSNSAPFQTSFFPADTYPQDYFPQEAPRQLFLHSASVGQQNFQNQQLVLTNPQFNPLAQGFVQNSLQYNNLQQLQQQQPQSQFVQLNSQFYTPGKYSTAATKGIVTPVEVQKPSKESSLRFVDGYKAENVSTLDYVPTKKKAFSTPVKSKLELVDKQQYASTTQRISDRSSTTRPISTSAPVTTVEKEEVQLLYVPLETLQNEKFDMKKFLADSQKQQEALRDSIGSPGQINNQLYGPTTPSYISRQTPPNIQEYSQQSFNAPSFQGKFKNPFERQGKYQQPSTPLALPFSQAYPTPTITTPKSKKLKAHQPPLAIYMLTKGQAKPKLTDVLGVLKDAKSVSVLDSFQPDSPKIFIGPSTLRAPNSYVKFELPYLSSIEGNRIQRKVEQLPFFVAPLSYKAPNGFARIPFPSPHVGSVIVNPFMMEPQIPLRPTTIAESQPSSFSYTTFPQNPSTESFYSTVSDPSLVNQNQNYFSSATPNPVISQQSTLSNYQSSFLPYDPSTFRPMPSGRKPVNIISSSRPPLSAYFSTPEVAKPTVSYFFPGPDYSTFPTTTKKAPNAFSYDNRGHYITNAAVDTSPPSVKSTTPIREQTTEKVTTTTTTTERQQPTRTTPKYQQQNPYSINQAFELRNPYEPTGIQSGVRANEIRNYNQDFAGPVTSQQSFSTISQGPLDYQEPGRPIDNVQFTTVNDYSPRPYFGVSSPSGPTEVDSPLISSLAPQQGNVYQNNENREVYSQNLNQYQVSSDNIDDQRYQTESPTTNEIVTPPPTTTSTTTTAAPNTRATRRPIVRGRPRYTTPKPDGTETTRSTTRRTPIRERKPNNTFRAKLESSKTSTTTESSEDFESSKGDTVKVSKRPTSRYQSQDDATKTTTESAPTKSVTTRNSRIRSRGRTQFKAADNYEGSDYVSKKSKKVGDDGKSIAYQRDVLHQNYPVTLSERRTTLEVRTSTPLPSSRSDVNSGKIRIYETTGVTQKSFSSDDLQKPSESSLDYYENQPIFQGEQEKFLTQPETYVQINSGIIESTPSIEQYVTAQDVTTTQRAEPSSSYKYDKVSQPVVEEYFSVTNNGNNNYETAKTEKSLNVEIVREDVGSTASSVEYTSEPVTESAVGKFRSKLRGRPKLLQSSIKLQSNEENGKNTEATYSVKKVEDNQQDLGFTRRSSLKPVTYRPAFDRRRTTMRIEDIAADLQTSRLQMRGDQQVTTSKYPVYVPEASTSSSAETVRDDDVTSTTKRNVFARRRPAVRVTTEASVTGNTRTRVTTTPTSVSDDAPKNRIRVRGRIRTRPTTTEKADTNQGSEEEEKYNSGTQRTNSQKYTTRGRQATQKYSRRPSVAKGNSAEDDDQASYDSINRPEYVEFNAESIKNEYNPENGKSESHWSPKISSNSFRPIFNPNLIAEEIKLNGAEFGTKLPESNTEKSDIITAADIYNRDTLIAVTPASNNLNFNNQASLFKEYPSGPDSYRNDKAIESTSTFESVLEEVMRNLEEQDEDEYNTQYKTIMKHEGGEIGEIPPETTAADAFVKETTPSTFQRDYLNSNENFERVTSYFVPTAPTESERFAEDRVYSPAPSVQTSTTERQPRRRGVWRRIKVRPANKEVFDGAESQHYGSTDNDLVNERKNIQEVLKEKPKQEKQNVPINGAPQTVTEQVEEVKKDEKKEDVDKVMSPGDMDLGTGAPEAIEVIKEVTTPVAINEETTAFEETASEEVKPTNAGESVKTNDKEIKEEVKTTVETIPEKMNATQNVGTVNEKDVAGEDLITTTPETPLDAVEEAVTEKVSEVEEDGDDSITDVLEKFWTDMDETEDDKKTDEDETESTTIQDESIHDGAKNENDESNMPPGVTFFDAKSIIGTSVSSEISQETEICYRGRCIKTKKMEQGSGNK